jgi:hypothetical protein
MRFGCKLLALVPNLLIKRVKPQQVRGRFELFYLHCYDPLLESRSGNLWHIMVTRFLGRSSQFCRKECCSEDKENFFIENGDVLPFGNIVNVLDFRERPSSVAREPVDNEKLRTILSISHDFAAKQSNKKVPCVV